MKKISLIALGLVLLSGSAMAEQESAQATGNGNAKAEIVSALQIESKQDLDFGKMLGQANTVTVNTAGQRSATTPAGLVQSTPTQGVIEVSGGVENQQITITGPVAGTSTEVTHTTDSSKKMTVSNYQTDPNGTTQLGAGGKTTINVGADLTVGADQATGTYTGTYPVEITY